MFPSTVVARLLAACWHGLKRQAVNPLMLNDLKTSQTMCQILEEFCSLLYEIPLCFGVL